MRYSVEWFEKEVYKHIEKHVGKESWAYQRLEEGISESAAHALIMNQEEVINAFLVAKNHPHDEPLDRVSEEYKELVNYLKDTYEN